MGRRGALIAAAVALLVGGGLVVWKPWRKDGAATRTGVIADCYGPTRRGGLCPDPAAPSKRATAADGPLAWVIPPGVEPRRIAGTVVFEGKPVAGAAVELR